MIGWLTAGLGLAAAAGLSARYNWWRPRRPGLPVLMYHHVTDELNNTPLPKLRVTTKAFAAQLDLLRAKGYQTVSLAQAMAPDAPANGVVLSFDDGYEDFYSQAWPLLRQRGMSATVFLVAGAIGGDNFWDRPKGEPREPLMDAARIRELAAAGVEFGGHGFGHVAMAGLSQADLARETIGCQEALGAILGQPCRVFSYPYGLYDAPAARAVGQAGFTVACTTRPGMLGPGVDPLAAPRIIVKRSDNLLDLRLKLTRGQSRL
ncbi:polysaccharide deacetylase [Desulfarculus baarsii DSM 2075]|uniref:Polysaccharide deacetylase n=1 Tax=Desulfarculus baarsii (strain ATCC 33931 / DSM 2075 / LMG 7858 / VKM B-1802 / 2st14) TaxID=644282 RepID=E1QEU9_DESB2|nr:polysaccharide deacetylase family protein [Desulfarculus baarsii]ADK84085.1 polysaccharide deacetylase [Desulfarculus baarsii DSM 2075]